MSRIVVGGWRRDSRNRLRVSPVNQAIAAIAGASTKNEWKRLCGDPVTAPGTRYHTWLLGLPRSQKFPRGGRLVRRTDFKTGYLLVNRADGPFFSRIDKRCNDRNTWSGSLKEVTWGDLRVEEPRRQSLIIAFPLPLAQNTGSDRVPPIAVVAFPAHDLLDCLTTSNSNGRPVLYHAGPHRWQKCSQVLIPVSTIASCPQRSLAGKPLGVRQVRRRGSCVDDCVDVTGLGGFKRLLRIVFESFLEALR